MNVDKTEIYDLSVTCQNLFQDILDGHGTQLQSVIDVLHERFIQWATHLGVFAREANRPRASLDSRLRCSESLRTLVLQYLTIIKDTLEYS